MANTIKDLQMLQALPLDAKILKTKQRIKEWVEYYGEDGVYVSFSGGKDSTVLLDIARQMYPNLKAVFVDTGLEYPEIREFVKTFDNVDWVRPKMNFKQVIKKYGYPFISKEVSNNVDGARKYLKILTDRQTDKFHMPITTEDYADLVNMLNQDWGKTKGSPQRLAIMMGVMGKGKAIIPSEKDRSNFSNVRYKFLLDCPWNISDKCCSVMKKNPVHEYSRETHRVAITAQTASESRLRTQKWLQNGCNSFKAKNPISNPMSFWLEQDVLLYIKLNNLPICSVYGDIVEDADELDGQMCLFDYDPNADIFDKGRPLLKTTGCDRTGCMFCGYGCHLEKEGQGRFERMKVTHPKQYDYIMRPKEQGGLNYKEVIDWLNENGNLHIRY